MAEGEEVSEDGGGDRQLREGFCLLMEKTTPFVGDTIINYKFAVQSRSEPTHKNRTHS